MSVNVVSECAGFVRDPSTEKWLEDLRVSYSLEEISLSDIDIEASRNNNARVGVPLDQNVADDYGLAMLSGAAFPAVILRLEGLQYFVLGGNHRIGGAEAAGIGSVLAYVVESQDTMILDLITRMDNRREGVRQTDQELVIHCIYLIEKYNQTIRDVAARFGKKESWLQQHIHAHQMRQKLLGWGLKVENASNAMLQEIERVGANHNIQRAVAKAAIKFNLKGSALRNFCRDVRASTTEAEAMKAVKDFVAEETAKQSKPARATVTHTMSHSFYSKFRGLKNFLEQGRNKSGPIKSLANLQITDSDDIEVVRKEWRELRKTLDGIVLR